MNLTLPVDTNTMYILAFLSSVLKMVKVNLDTILLILGGFLMTHENDSRIPKKRVFALKSKGSLYAVQVATERNEASFRKKRQHYIFKKYLESWNNSKGQIFCSRLQTKIFETSCCNVASEQYFYKINPLNKNERTLLTNLINTSFYGNTFLDDNIEEIIDYLIKPSIIIEHLNKLKEQLNDQIPEKSIIIEEKFKDVFDVGLTARINWLEDWHCQIELSGLYYISNIKNKEIDFYSADLLCPQSLPELVNDDNFNFLHFVCVQAFRTKKQRVLFRKAIDDATCQLPIGMEEMNVDNIHNIFQYFQSLKLAIDLRRANVNITLVENKTKLPFITSDQPVVIKEGLTASVDNTNVLPQLYYPISPDLAVLINHDNLPLKMTLDEEINVDTWNKLMFECSHEMVFSNSEKVLEDLLKC